MKIENLIEDKHDKPPSQANYNQGTGNEYRQPDRDIRAICGLLAGGRQMGAGIICAALLRNTKQFTKPRLALVDKTLKNHLNHGRHVDILENDISKQVSRLIKSWSIQEED